MVKGVSLIVTSVFALIVQIKSVSFVNNVTVPNDILTTIFFNEIKNNPNLLDLPIQNTGVYNKAKCVAALQQIVGQFPSLSVLPFIDSWGKFPSGILFGHLRDLGNYDQCVRTSVTLNNPIGTVKGRYCFAAVPLVHSQLPELPKVVAFNPYANERALADLLKLSIAICIPDICDPSVVEKILQMATKTIFHGALSAIEVNQCVATEKPDLQTINIVGILIFSIIAALMVLSTAYDIFTVCLKITPAPSLLAFSVLTNGRKLFAINTKKSADSIDCLTGIRVLSMLWVLLCHTYMAAAVLPFMNYVDLIPWSTAASSMHILSATVSVDSFFFISGLLIAWLGFRELEKSKGRLNLPLMYFHRYIRLTPAVAAVMLFFLSIYQYIGSGPFRESYNAMHIDDCKERWWPTLLYVQNYVNPDDICVMQTWYLGVDTQLYLLSPLILIPLWKWGRKFAPIMVVLSLLSIGCVIAIFFAEGYTSFFEFREDKQLARTYMPTHTRLSVWLVGLGLGYYMYKNKNKPMRPPKLVQILGWIVCFGTILAIIYGPYLSSEIGAKKTVLAAAMYETMKRVSWGIALAWIVFACHFGFGGIINSFLSHPWWQPLGRLTFSMYLVHMGVQGINFGSTRTDIFFSDYQMILYFWASFGISVLAAIVLTLGFESPILVIEKSLFSGSSRSKASAAQ